jgi:hypothetical protein
MHHSLTQRLLAFVFALSAFGAPARAHDHMDAPLVAQDLGADIGDVFFFLDPNNNNFAVMAATVHPFINPNQNANAGFFDHSVAFRFLIENTGDAVPDRLIVVTHSKELRRNVSQTARIQIGPVPGVLPEGRAFSTITTVSRAAFGPIGPPTFGGGSSTQQTPAVHYDDPSRISYFGGLVDDPFFFDHGAWLAYRDSRFEQRTNPAILTRGRDSFAGVNTMAICLRVPVNLLRGSASNVVGLTVYAQRQNVSNAAKT